MLFTWAAPPSAAAYALADFGYKGKALALFCAMFPAGDVAGKEIILGRLKKTLILRYSAFITRSFTISKFPR
jgi:hypothetical protein